MAKTMPGRLMHDFEPALADRGNSFVGMVDVGLLSVNVTISVGTAGAYPGVPVLHSLKVAPSYWTLTPRFVSLQPFIAWTSATAADTSACYYIAAFTMTNVNAAAPAVLTVWR
jgi:hypothetical protein